MQHTIEVAWREAHRFDIVHAHMENHGFVFAEHCETPVITTLHGRLDAAGHARAARGARPTSRWSRSARASAGGSRTSTGSRRSTTACRSSRMPFCDRAGRLPRVRRPDHAREGHRGGDRAEPRDAASGSRSPPRCISTSEHAHFDEVVQPAIDADEIDFLGEVGPEERDPLFAGRARDRDARRLAGAVRPRRDRVDGDRHAGHRAPRRRAHRDDRARRDRVPRRRRRARPRSRVEQVAELDRRAIRERTLERFSPQRMADEYEVAYRQVLASRPSAR